MKTMETTGNLLMCLLMLTSLMPVSAKDFDSIREQSRSANVTVPEGTTGVFGWCLQNLNYITECDLAVAAKADALEPRARR